MCCTGSNPTSTMEENIDRDARVRACVMHFRLPRFTAWGLAAAAVDNIM
jgi:hypothetical protein